MPLAPLLQLSASPKPIRATSTALLAADGHVAADVLVTVAAPQLTTYDERILTYATEGSLLTAARAAYDDICGDVTRDSYHNDCAARRGCIDNLLSMPAPPPLLPPGVTYPQPPLPPVSPPELPPALPPAPPSYAETLAISFSTAFALIVICAVVFLRCCRRSRAGGQRRNSYQRRNSFQALRRLSNAGLGKAKVELTPVHSPGSSRDVSPMPGRPPTSPPARLATSADRSNLVA